MISIIVWGVLLSPSARKEEETMPIAQMQADGEADCTNQKTRLPVLMCSKAYFNPMW